MAQLLSVLEVGARGLCKLLQESCMLEPLSMSLPLSSLFVLFLLCLPGKPTSNMSIASVSLCPSLSP